ncbi:hypothetical protein FJQ98_12940 [Lysinibacillus agricola]|uniref:Lipoprotein n=1 Tax=Lysinibacillus agricola TaxID=2590012 RepID=A0ABX7AMW1_9BACI|nr:MULTISPECIES: hypothetical protein [Lysinibacillus]KOS64127.1 hypothetical protein AN161_03730 [Lysinibacillus sp. FJAT-14222]QQP10218.1 hypothetical protein FJQ98_12940 [Lysinibacillus agricola]
MKKRMGTLLMLSAVMFSGCNSDNQEENKQEKTSQEMPSEQVTIPQDAKLIGSSENGEVELYAEANGVKLDFNGKVKDFDWTFYDDIQTKPQVFYTDVTGDGNEEAVIIIKTGNGTGLDTDEIHVVNKDLTEIKVQGYEDIVANNIESNVVKNDNGTLGITVKVQGKEHNFDYEFDPAPDLQQDQLAFGGIIIYFLENQKIKLNLVGSVGVSPTYVADFNITYKFDSTKNEFIVDQIEFKPVKN